jgi:hypothetical protein
VSPSPTFVIASSISSFEVNSPSVKTPFTIPKAKSRRGLCLVNRVSAITVKHDASRISMPLLIHCGTRHCPHVFKRSPAGSDDENSCLPFSNRENSNRQNLAG